MSLIVSAYDSDDEGNENRVCFWLRLDAWGIFDAAMVLVEIDPDDITLHKKSQDFESVRLFRGERYPSIDDRGFRISLGQDDMANDYFEGQDELTIYQKKYDDMRRILYNLDDNEYDTPSYWIERAIAKKVNIPWLEFAIRKGFYVPKKDDAIKQVTDKPLSDKERESMIKIIHALAKNGYKYPNHGTLAEIVRDFETNNNGVSENTLIKYLDMFDSL